MLWREYGLGRCNQAIYVQCFCFAEIKRFTQRVRRQGQKLIQLIGDKVGGEAATDYTPLQTPAMLGC